MLLGKSFHRVGLIFTILALFSFSFPQPVSAAVATIPSAAVTVHFDVIAVKAEQSVTIRTKDFPIRTKFTVRMDVVGNQAVNGTIVDEFNSDQGGEIVKTYPIPVNLRGQIILAIHIESVDGYVANNWFFNEDSGQTPPNPAEKPALTFSDAKKDASVTVEATNLIANTSYWVRVGPYYTFYRDYIFAQTVTSDANGAVKFTLTLPDAFKNTDYIMVRMDHDDFYAFNVYQNVDGGAAQEINKLYKFSWCKVLLTAPVPELAPGEQFDAIWTIQNTSNMNWDGGTIGYKFYSGEKMQKYKDIYSVNWTVPDGRYLVVDVDMIAPTQPGWHTTTWTMFRDNENSEVDTNMCQMKINVFVKGN